MKGKTYYAPVPHTKMYIIILALLLFFTKGDCQCFEPYGRFAVTGQCDAYVECIEGIPHQRYCPAGLFFKDEPNSAYPCGYSAEVNCQGRAASQPANPSKECPNSFAKYAIGGPNDCGVFLNCVHGKAYVQTCPEGLAFHDEQLQCEWPDLVPTCNAEAYVGFSCPDASQEKFYQSGYCDRFYACIYGKPRLMKCEKGKAFNPEIGKCDYASNVLGC